MGSYFENNSFTFCGKFIKKHYWLFVGMLIVNFILGIITLSNTYMMALLVDKIQNNGTLRFVVKFLIVYICIQVIKVILTFVSQIVIAKYNLRFTNEITTTVLSYLQKVKILALKNFSSVYLSERINADANVLANFVMVSTQNALIQLFLLLVLFLIMFIISAKYAILLLGVCFAYSIAYLIFRKSMYTKMKEYHETAANYLKSVNEQITFINFIQINNLYESFMQRFKKAFETLFHNGISLQVTTNYYVLVQSLIYLCVYSVIILTGGKGLINKDITIGQFTMIFTYTGGALSAINGLLGFGQIYQNAKTSYDRLRELSKLESVQSGSLICKTIQTIDLEHASFTFDSNVGLKDLTIHFEKGQNYLLLGGNGSGKSTLIYLILDQYQYLTGKIMINDVDLREYDMLQVKSDNFAVMEQELDFLENTIVDYINMCNKTAYTEKQIMKCLVTIGFERLACDLMDLIARDITNINFTSGGEKQKVEIARIVLKDSDVLIFDEPTAHLDYESRDEFYRYIESVKNEKIVIVVSHMKEEREHFDHIIQIEQYSMNCSQDRI